MSTRPRARLSRLVATAVVTALCASTLSVVLVLDTVLPAEAAPYDSVILGDAPVSYWRLGDSCSSLPCSVEDQMTNFDGTETLDGSGFGADGVVPGDDALRVMPYTVQPVEFVSTTAGADTLHPDDFTIETWIKGHPVCGNILSALTFYPTDETYETYVTGGYRLGGMSCDNESDFQGSVMLGDGSSFASVSAYFDAGVHHIVMTKDHTALTLYVDGRVASSDSTDNLATFYDSGHLSDPIRTADYAGNGSGWVEDELAFYDYALTSDQVRTHFFTNPNWLNGGPLKDDETRGGGSPSQCFNVSQATLYPVALPSGEFWHTFEDFAFPGRGAPLSLTHTYSSTLADVEGPLGYGWSMSYGMSLSVDGGSVELTRFVGHLILGAAQGKEARGGSSSEVSRGVPA